MKNKGSFLLIYLLTLSLIFSSCSKKPKELLLEAESFKEKGGWLVDPQFVEQMGSPYLLAHGLGIPVQNAKTSVDFPGAGSYYTWVRTRNWAPGPWESPGRFKLVVDNKEMDVDPGSDPDWKWHFAGMAEIEGESAVIELKDMDGFDGRCDAIYFSTLDVPPPDGKEEMALFRQNYREENESPEITESYDLVIVGGGIAGCAAAIAAAEQGLDVALIHDRPVLGGNASSEIRVHTLGITWHYDRILGMLNTRHYPNGSPEAMQEDEKRMNNIKKYDNIHLFLNWRAYATNTRDDSITSVDARQTENGERKRFTAPHYIDCTGDGWIGYWAGAGYMYGREDSSEYSENWEEHGELWSPAKADDRVMGSSVLWRTVEEEDEVVFPDIPWAKEAAEGHEALNGEWFWEFSEDSLNQVSDGEKIRDHMLKAIYGSFSNAKQKEENANYRLEWVSYLLGKRESRRLVGDYIYTFNDMREMREFDDAVVMEKREVDVHYQQNLVDSTSPGFYSEALFYHVDHYYVPYRSLYSKNIKNLFMAGRCFSCTHVGLGGPRVMNTTGQMGAATGYAASLCNKYELNPRDIYTTHLGELKELIESSSEPK